MRQSPAPLEELFLSSMSEEQKQLLMEIGLEYIKHEYGDLSCLQNQENVQKFKGNPNLRISRMQQTINRR